MKTAPAAPRPRADQSQIGADYRTNRNPHGLVICVTGEVEVVILYKRIVNEVDTRLAPNNANGSKENYRRPRGAGAATGPPPAGRVAAL
ncbi:hypothetical protein EVAR_22892_1 [Eumeta japonica]|uniref:Uncharacterized protein n=1 Tax=Eumeta variegata TaxID=151549 RepID=A0A4C1UVH6_EUMVA|nr:hypothetical protein EVAR_22892_1 [Eumeta japonica]